MPLPDFAQGIQYSFLDSANRARLQAHAASTTGTSAAAASKTAASENDLTFDDLVDIVNPLQHLPIVGTLYRHFAHDPIKPLPKMAGDALYGGWMGLASSVADYAFEKITGKNFGDTVLAMVTGDDSAAQKPAMIAAGKPPPAAAPATKLASTPTAPVSKAPTVIAAATPAASPKPADATPSPPASGGADAQVPTIDAATLNAFMAAVNSKGIDSDLGQRTLDAYRRTVGLQAQSTAAPVTVH